MDTNTDPKPVEPTTEVAPVTPAETPAQTVVTPTTSTAVAAGGSSNVLTWLLVAIVLVLVGIAGYLVYDNSQKDKDSKDTTEETADDKKDDKKEDKSDDKGFFANAQKGLDTDFRISMVSEDGTEITITKDARNKMTSVISKSDGEEVEMYSDKDGTTYFYSEEEGWLKFSAGSNSMLNPMSYMDTLISGDFLKEIANESNVDLKETGSANCKGSSGKCKVFTATDEEGEGVIYVTSNGRLDYIESIVEGVKTTMTYEYKRYPVTIPAEAKNAMDYGEMFNNLFNSDELGDLDLESLFNDNDFNF